MQCHSEPDGAVLNLLFKADLTALGLGIHQVEYDGSNEAERLEADRHINRLTALVTATRPERQPASYGH
jgi:hypothetical protein